jgi:hypothetical protein
MAVKKKDIFASVTEKAFKLGMKKGKKKTTKPLTTKQLKRDSPFDIKVQTGAKKSIVIQRQILSKNQDILNGMFGGSVGQRVLGDTRPKINKTLQGGDSPFGLVENGDNGYTSSLMLPRGRRGGRIF